MYQFIQINGGERAVGEELQFLTAADNPQQSNLSMSLYRPYDVTRRSPEGRQERECTPPPSYSEALLVGRLPHYYNISPLHAPDYIPEPAPPYTE